MPYTIKTRFLAEASGSGEERKIAGFSTLTTPTQCSGPIRQVFTATAAPVDLVSVITGELVALYLEAITSNLFFNPVTSANISISCYISQGAFAYNPYQTGTTALPWARAVTSRAEAEIWYAAVS